MDTESGTLREVERALHESEARLQQVLDNTSAVVFAKDRAGRYLFVNREFERVAARPATEVIGRTDGDVFPPDLATRFRHNDLRVLQEKRAIEFEESGDFGGGADRTYLAAKFPLCDADGAAYAVCGIATDITERKRLEEALSSSALAVSTSEGETLYRGLTRYLATILGVEGAIIATIDTSNPGTMQVLAFYLDGQIVENFDYPLTGTPCQTVVGQQFRLYSSRVTELFPVDADFRKLGIESYAGYPLNDAAGHARGLIAVISRKTLERPAFVESVLRIFAVRASAEMDRARAAEALRASEASYRQVFEASEDSIFVHDWDTGAIVDVNPRACACLGYSHEELLRLRADELSSCVPPYTEADALRWIERAKQDGVARFEWHRRNKDGSLHWDEVVLKSARIAGRPRVLAFTREITERKQREEQLRRSEAQLRQAKKMEAIGQLTGGIAHDFNNLLTSIMGYVVLASERQERFGDGCLEGYLVQARRSCERARDLIQQMLMFSRGQRGAPRPVAVGRVVQESLQLVRSALPATMNLEADIAADGTTARLDPLQLEQVLLNLCINARDASGGVGPLHVGVRPVLLSDAICAGCRASVSGAFVELGVRDQGHGMAADVVERIFEPFYSTKEAGKGTGMGLAIVHGIVHEHGGHVVVDTEPGRGATFRVLFAALPADSPAAPSATAQQARSPQAHLALEGSVLVVDDNESVGGFMRELLESWGLRTSHLARPQEAIVAVTSEPARFDAVITDQAMPRMTGLQLSQALHAIRADLPIILYTGYSEGLTEREIEAANLRAVLRKPVDPGALRAALSGCVQSCIASAQ